MLHTDPIPAFCGQAITATQLHLIQEVTARYPGLTRTELAATVCELLDWLRPNGKLKCVEARLYLEKLEQQQHITLPPQRKKRSKRTAVAIAPVDQASQQPIRSVLCSLYPITLQRVTAPAQRKLWRSLVDQYHYLGHKIPFGAHLRYLIQSQGGLLGCLQFSSPAWRLHCRDQWIGWRDEQRKAHLQHILCNSRFLILPWVQVPNLASHVLAKSARQVIGDWTATYHVVPWLLESMVDSRRFAGTCYRAANWIEVGETTGRGRNDRHHRHHQQAPKRVWLYPLHPHSRDQLGQSV